MQMPSRSGCFTPARMRRQMLEAPAERLVPCPAVFSNSAWTAKPGVFAWTSSKPRTIWAKPGLFAGAGVRARMGDDVGNPQPLGPPQLDDEGRDRFFHSPLRAPPD